MRHIHKDRDFFFRIICIKLSSSQLRYSERFTLAYNNYDNSLIVRCLAGEQSWTFKNYRPSPDS